MLSVGNNNRNLHSTYEPEAVDDRGGLQTPEGSERCPQSWRRGGSENR